MHAIILNALDCSDMQRLTEPRSKQAPPSGWTEFCVRNSVETMRLNGFVISLCVALVSASQPLHGQENVSADKQFSEWRTKAEKGDAEAQFTVGYFYAVGQGVAKDEIEAVKWYRKAADQNLAGAQFNLASCYDRGQGVAKDMTEAVKWYRKAADQNLALAQFNLGSCYMHGEGVALNEMEAVKWYRKAAEQNCADAQYNLGRCYLRAQGVAQDNVEGYKWYLLSSAQGYEIAKASIAKLEAALPPKQVAEGKQRANDWLKNHPKP